MFDIYASSRGSVSTFTRSRCIGRHILEVPPGSPYGEGDGFAGSVSAEGYVQSC